MPTNLSNQVENKYRLLFDTCIISEKKLPEIDEVISKMVKSKGSLSFKKHLHNGDPLTARTVQVPKGRPTAGKPPFTWEESAVDALTMEGFTTKTDWSISGMLSSFEKYNGMGYRKRGIHSPYLWSFSNHFTRGKFTADGVFDHNAISKQVGAAVLLRRMSEKQIAVKGEDAITRIKRLGEEVLFDPDNFHENASQLQTLLNSIGLHLRVDGKAGKITSDAYKTIAGKFLKGDKR